jgi:hypothetical protein
LTVKDSKGRKGKTRPASPSKSSSPTGGSNSGGRRHRGGDVGAALRSVYDRAVREEIPPEMLDLLGKLG